MDRAQAVGLPAALVAKAGFENADNAYITSFSVGVCLKTVPREGEEAGESFVDEVGAAPGEMLVTVRVSGLQQDVLRHRTAEQIQSKFTDFLDKEVESFEANLSVKMSAGVDVMQDPHESVEWMSYGTRGETENDQGGKPALIRAIFEIVERQQGLSKDQVAERQQNDPLDAKHQMVVSMAVAFAQFLKGDGGLTMLQFKSRSGGDADVLFEPGNVHYDDQFGVAYFPMIMAKVDGEFDDADLDANGSLAVEV